MKRMIYNRIDTIKHLIYVEDGHIYGLVYGS